MSLQRRLLVSHVIKPRQKRISLKKSPESRGVKFFNRLERSGPLNIRTLPIYERWTKEVRTRMETEGTWPVGLQEITYHTVVHYLKHLQKVYFETPALLTLLKKGYTPRRACDVFTSTKDEFTTLFYLWYKMRRALIRLDVCKLDTVYTFPYRYRINTQAQHHAHYLNMIIIELTALSKSGEFQQSVHDCFGKPLAI